MLVLTRKIGESIVIPGYQITVTVLDIARCRVRLGLQAPNDINIRRSELPDRAMPDQDCSYGTRPLQVLP
jgi:carbon storage regulator